LELALIIEKHRGKALPAAITSYLVRHFRREIRGIKGPKLQSDVVKDFRFGPAANLYDRKLPLFEYLAKRRKRPTVKRRKKANSRLFFFHLKVFTRDHRVEINTPSHFAS
jgi:hypothetical protein